VVITNRVEILNRDRRHISYVFPKISRSLELLRASCKSFCVQVPVWGDFKESSKISHFMKSNELKFWEKIVDITLHVSKKFPKDSRSYVSDVTSQSCYDRSLHQEDIKTNFWSEANTTWENLKGVWRLGSTNTLSRPSYESLVCNHVLNTIQDIIQYTYIYIKPMYNIEFHIILKTYIHIQGPSCLTLTLTLILET
jgi:hypothetical protein